MGKPVEIVVSHVEGKLEDTITAGTTGQELFETVCGKLGMEHITLFSFAYKDAKGYDAFVKLDKKILKQDVNKKEIPLNLNFRAKFFPEAVNDELIGDVVQRLFWKQIKEGIVDGSIYCPAELCVLFAAQSMQAQYADFNEAEHDSGVLKVYEELPKRVIEQHSLSFEQWQDRIRNAWKQQSGVTKEQSIMDYLNIAQDLEQYGITYFEITNKKGTRLYLGVHNLGMDIYELNNKVTPRLGFPWAEIRNISFNDKKFIIKMVAKDAPDFRFYSPRFKLNKRILALCVGNHQFFVSRRRAQVCASVSPLAVCVAPFRKQVQRVPIACVAANVHPCVRVLVCASLIACRENMCCDYVHS
eukprot:m.752003 g.752003  ORF g.752003 m.752003 type:complete len:357 (+) comp23168_c0_seq49:209-1279(+)